MHGSTPWGNSDDMVKTRLRHSESAKNGTVPVGSIEFARSPYGVADLVMNASEWVNDWYAEDFIGPRQAGIRRAPRVVDSRCCAG